MVTILNISENKMDNRGSKSTILDSMVVKEQRVDDSWSIKPHFLGLRYTLRGFERNRGIKLGFNKQNCWNSYVKTHLSNSKKNFFYLFSFYYTYISTIIRSGV